MPKIRLLFQEKIFKISPERKECLLSFDSFISDEMNSLDASTRWSTFFPSRAQSSSPWLQENSTSGQKWFVNLSSLWYPLGALVFSFAYGFALSYPEKTTDISRRRLHWFPHEMRSGRLMNEHRNSILMTFHNSEMDSASDWLCREGNLFEPISRTAQIWVVTGHQNGISAFVASRGVSLFCQATSLSFVLFLRKFSWRFLGLFISCELNV